MEFLTMPIAKQKLQLDVSVNFVFIFLVLDFNFVLFFRPCSLRILIR